MELMYDDRAGENLPEGWEETLEAVAKRTLAYTNAPERCEISLSFVTPDEIRQLNRDYRQKDSETDVLSFPFCDGPPVDDGVLPPILGDIVICTRVAVAQAEEYGHALTREIAFLTVHGLLHLLGYDHEQPDDEAEMNAAQDAILEQAGIGR